MRADDEGHRSNTFVKTGQAQICRCIAAAARRHVAAGLLQHDGFVPDAAVPAYRADLVREGNGHADTRPIGNMDRDASGDPVRHVWALS